jgi:hypothetical protein
MIAPRLPAQVMGGQGLLAIDAMRGAPIKGFQRVA